MIFWTEESKLFSGDVILAGMKIVRASRLLAERVNWKKMTEKQFRAHAKKRGIKLRNE
jgi:hypothetical protein